MKTNVRMLKSEKGFSLIELMIVVAIIAILATIAVPNFNKMTAKAKQSEAKSMLSAMYTAEKAFFAEWSSYYGGFADIGFTPEGKMNYDMGFPATGPVPAANFVAAIAPSVGAGCVLVSTCNSLIIQKTASFLASGALVGGVTPSSTVFTAAAASALIPGNNADRWTMTQDRLLTNTQVGL